MQIDSNSLGNYHIAQMQVEAGFIAPVHVKKGASPGSLPRYQALFCALRDKKWPLMKDLRALSKISPSLHQIFAVKSIRKMRGSQLIGGMQVFPAPQVTRIEV